MKTLSAAVKNASSKNYIASRILLAAMVALFLYPLSAFAQCTATWNGGTGSWDAAGNWTPSGIPTSASNTCINAASSAVTINGSDSTNNLMLGSSSDSLTISNDNVLSIASGGNISNAGAITMGSVGNATELSIGGNTTLSGSGTLTMSNNNQNYILGGGTLTNHSTIQGAGNIGNGNLTLINSGTIDANQSIALQINANGGTTNTGTMEATAGGTLLFENGYAVNNTNGTILATGTNSVVNLSTGSITNGIFTTTSGGVIDVTNSFTLNTVTISTGSTVNVLNDDILTLGAGTVTNNGSINLQSIGNATELSVTGTTTLAGTGTVTMSSSNGNYVDYILGGGTLTNQETIQGAGTIGNNALTLVNSGTIDANVSGATLTINPNGGTTNTGTMEATAGGTLLFVSDGVTNTGGLIEATGTGSVVNLSTGSITGGTLTSSGGGVFNDTNNFTLNSLTISTGTTMNVLNNEFLTLGGTTFTNNGSINLQSIGNATELIIPGTTTLAGTGTVTMSSSNGNYADYILGGGTLTNKETIQGAGTIGNNALTLVNSGIIDANVSGATLTINPNGGTTNTGTMEATAGGTLLFVSDGVTNTGALIEATGTGSVVNLSTGSITGGTLTSSGGGVFNVTDEFTLNSLTISTGTTMNVLNNEFLTLSGTTFTNNGSINLQSIGNATELIISGTTTLAGTGTVTLTGSTNPANFILGGGTLTNQETIQGAGTIGNGNLTLVNAGTIDANSSGHTLIINPNGGTTNTKTMEATAGGTLEFVSDGVTNTGGLIEATGTGSIVNLNTGSITGGTLTSSGGGVFNVTDEFTLTGVTISTGSTVNVLNSEFLSLGAGTITNKGTINLESSGNATELILDGNVTLTAPGKVIMSANSQNFILGSGNLTNQGIIEGAGNIGDGEIGLINTGTIEANATKAPFDTLIIDASGTGFSNNVGAKEGTLSVSKNNTLIIEGGPFNNYNSASGTLTGGKYNVTGTFEFNAGTLGIVTNDAAITLTGTVAKVLNTNESNASALTGFTTNGSAGTFTVNAGTFTDANTFTNQGIIAVGSAGKFDSTGTLTNFNSTTSTLTGGSYTLTATGQFQFNNQGDTSDIVTNDAKITLAGVDTTKSSIIDQTGANALANFNANGSTGSLTLTTDRNFATTAGFTNAGTVTVSKSTGTGHTLLTINGSYQNTGTTTVDGMLTATSINVTGGFVYGNLGTLTGAFDLTGGTLNPGDGIKKEGTLNIAGNYTETGSGILNIDLDGTVAGTKYDVLNISGTAALGGTLDFDLISTFKPTVGETFDVINYSSETGSFTTVNLPTAPAGDHWTFACGATDCTLTLNSGAAGPAAQKSVPSAAPAKRVSPIYNAAVTAGSMREPSAILTRAETCGGFRTFASLSCVREAISSLANVGVMHAVASHGTAVRTLHNNVATVAMSGVGVRTVASHTSTASATSMARLYMCAYMPESMTSTMGCR